MSQKCNLFILFPPVTLKYVVFKSASVSLSCSEDSTVTIFRYHLMGTFEAWDVSGDLILTNPHSCYRLSLPPLSAPCLHT